MIVLLLRGALRSSSRTLPILGNLAALAAVGALSRADSAIAGLPGGLLLPLAAAAANRAAGADTRRAADALVDRGIAPLRATLMHWTVCFVLIAATLLLSGITFLALAHRPGDLSLPSEILHSTPVLVVAALAYASYYALAGSFWRGHGLTLAVILDLVLGPAGSFGWIFPQSHLAELLGATPRSLGPHSHFAWLYALCIVYGALAIARTRHAAPALP